jgi:hypothetical protein
MVSPWSFSMGFFQTPARRLHIVRACGSLVLAVVIGAFSFTPDVDYTGRIICLALAGLCVLMTFFNLWRARRTPSSATVTRIPALAPISVQAQLYRRLFWLSVIAFPIMTAGVAYDLYQIENGHAERAEIWAPLVPIYEHLGYWPTVASLIGLGIACCTVFIVKSRNLTAKKVS